MPIKILDSQCQFCCQQGQGHLTGQRCHYGLWGRCGWNNLCQGFDSLSIPRFTSVLQLIVSLYYWILAMSKLHQPYGFSQCNPSRRICFPVSGSVQRWCFPVETARKPYCSCKGKRSQDEQQPCLASKRHVCIFSWQPWLFWYNLVTVSITHPHVCNFVFAAKIQEACKLKRS